MSASEKEDRIRERAYRLWQADGEPHGRSDEYWNRAEAMEHAAADEVPAAVATTEPAPKARPATAPKKPAAPKAAAAAPPPPAKPARRKPPTAKS